MTKDLDPVIKLTIQEDREAMSATRSLQKTRASVILNEDSDECDKGINEASNIQVEKETKECGISSAVGILDIL